jgi:histidine triad (HIT) family protein
MENCIFCKIVKKEIPAEVIYEDDNFLAFLDIQPVNPGHVLLIPKTHYKTLVDAPDEILAKIIVRAKKLMATIKDAMAADLVVLSVVGVDVPHFHIHLLPRYHDDGLANFWPTKKYKSDEIKKIGAKIRQSL